MASDKKAFCIYGNEDCPICPQYSASIFNLRDPYLMNVHDVHLVGQFLTSFFEKSLEIIEKIGNWWSEKDYGSKTK